MGTQYTRIHWPPRYPNQRPQARHLQPVYKDREEEFESQEYPAPTCPSCPLFLFIQTATAAPEKQHWPSAHLSGRKELLNLLLLSHHCKESTNLLAKEVIKERVTSNVWKLQSFFSDLPNWEPCQLPSLASAHLPCGLGQTQEEMNPCHNSLRKRECCKNAHFKNQLYWIPTSFQVLEATNMSTQMCYCNIWPLSQLGWFPPSPHLPSFHNKQIPGSEQSRTPIPLLHAMLLGSVSKYHILSPSFTRVLVYKWKLFIFLFVNSSLLKI